MKRRVLAALLMIAMILSMGTITVFAAEGDEEPSQTGTITAPKNEKKLIDNGDGTYTLSLSVTGAAESSTTTEVTKANVILVLDTSNSMNQNNTTYNGETMTRLAAEKHVLTDDGGIIDSLLSQNVEGDPNKSDIIEIALANFGTRGTRAQSFTTSATQLKDTINGFTNTQGTNWEEGLMRAQEFATEIKSSQPNEEIYIIFLTDGEPTTHLNDYTVNTNYAQEWAEANDNALEIVEAGYHFYGIVTWGSGNSSHYLSSLVNYAYTGSGNSNAALDPAYAEYFTDATNTEDLIDALEQISHDITNSVGFTDVEMTDGVTSMTASSVKVNAEGDVTGIKYYRSGGKYSTTENNGLGEEWTEGPPATINSAGEVDWGLGEIVLEDGVTYTITFIVWPKQESLDLVADLNNGIRDYNELTEAQKGQIVVTGGHYTLKTNTDSPTVTYSVVTTTTVDGETKIEKSDPVTVTITNPDPVPLAEEKLNAKKEWEDSMDESQREEVGTSVTLYLLVDGEYYYTEDGKPVGVVLTEDSNWTETDYLAVAPGLMVTSDSPAYDSTKPQVTWNGKTYAIIEPGHEYVFEESDINYHFELTAYTHHPMQIGNKVYDVLFTKDESGNITGIESASEMGDTISATNTLKGGINIVKKVVDENGEEIETNDPFTVKVTLTDADGEKLPDKKSDDGKEFNIDYRIYYGTKNPAYETSGEKHRSDHIYVSGTEFTETLYVGDTIRVVNVESGTVYTVTEPSTSKGYEYVETTYELAYAGKDENKDEDPDHTVQGNSASYATVANKYTFGDLEVSKTVEAPEGVTVDTEFEFTLKLYTDKTKATELKGTSYDYTIGSDKKGTVAAGGTFKLKDGEKITISKLPEGVYFDVLETALKEYTVKSEGASGEIVKDKTQTAAFTNTYVEVPETVTFTVTKKWEDDNNKDLTRPDSVKVKLLADGKDTGKVLELSKATEWTGKFEELDKLGADGKEIKYTVEEAEVPKGYTAEITGDVEKGFVITNSIEVEVPPTGDTTNLLLWGGMSLTSLFALGYLFIKRRKEEQ